MTTATEENARDEEIEAAQVMLARVGETVVAVPVEALREVMRGRATTRIPGAAPWIAGLVAARGALVPVADLRRRSGDAAGAAPWLAVVEHTGRVAALGVTALDGVQRVAESLARASRTSDALPRAGAARLLSENVAESGDTRDVDLLDLAALFGELFEGA